MITEEDKVNLKRGIKCNANKIDELTKDFKGRTSVWGETKAPTLI